MWRDQILENRQFAFTLDETWQDVYLRIKTACIINAGVTGLTYALVYLLRLPHLFGHWYSPANLALGCALLYTGIFYSVNYYLYRQRVLTPKAHLFSIGTGIYLFNTITITVLIHLTGGVESLFPLVYVIMAMVGSFLAPRNLVLMLALLGALLHGTLLYLGHHGLISSYPSGLYVLSKDLPRDVAAISLFTLNTFMTVMFLFFGQRLYRIFESQREQLAEARTELSQLVEEKTRDLTESIERNRQLIQQEHLLKEENEALRNRLLWPDPGSPFVGESVAIQKVFRNVEMVAPTSETVLINGETGAGKELVARLIHLNSNRRQRPILVLDCPSIPDALFESELFGHVKGAFTDAYIDRKGILTEGDGGTVFLDEIGELPGTIQAKLLRFLEEGVVRPVGANLTRKVDVRILAATNRNLEAMVESGHFRRDLFHRLSVFRIRVPSLAERIEDIPALAQCFLDQFNKKSDKTVKGFKPETLREIERISYPGNVRQLKNIVVSSAILVTDGQLMEPEHLFETLSANSYGQTATKNNGVVDLRSLTEDFERKTIMQYLVMNKQDRTKTAKVFGISRQALWKRMKRLGLLEQE